jgi:hypothetical protein
MNDEHETVVKVNDSNGQTSNGVVLRLEMRQNENAIE